MANGIADHKEKSYEILDDHLSERIIGKLHDLSPISPNRCIFEVPKHMRIANEKAYEPQVIAIGPYHRGKGHLKAMEEYKLRYLKQLLQRKEDNIKSYISAVRSLEERARSCYAKSVSLEKDEFVEMMLLDSCFIVELLRKYTNTRLQDKNDSLFQLAWFNDAVSRDLLLLENQLPFFVIVEFFSMTLMPNEHNRFRDMISTLFSFVLPGGMKPRLSALDNQDSIKNNKHLLGLLHSSWLIIPSSLETMNEKWNFIRSVTELQEAGIKFKISKGSTLFDIKFDNGKMEIPILEIGDRTETLFRNLVAYEQFLPKENLNYVTDYIALMKSLINFPKDVEVLREVGIIDNWLGDDEVVANMFNRLGDSVSLSRFNFYYIELFNKVNKHCERRRYRWIANLRHNYFNSPWAFISFLAAFSLILLTVAQTVFSVLAL